MLLEYAATDWLNTQPVFYNEKTGAISHNMNEVIDYSDFSFNAEGLKNYLKFGYTVYGQTMVENVKSLDCCSQITKKSDGTLEIIENEDVADKLWNPGQDNAEEVFETLITKSKEWADSCGGDTRIILPLSGGLDSRLLAYSVKDKENVRAYSYGLSANQRMSFEVVKAEQVAKSCDIKWKHVELDKFLGKSYIDKWYDLYGPSVHLHGMYQMEFYDKIITDNPNRSMRMLSGIIGDGWAGTVRIPAINSVEDLAYLGYTHGMSVDENVCVLKGSDDCATDFYNRHKDRLQDENYRVLYAMRFKMMLLNYLLKTPESYGMKTWSPFIEPDIAMAILNLDWKHKENRVWQYREFEKRGLDIGWEKDKCDYNMVLDIETLRKNPVKPLDEDLLSEVVKREYVQEVNKYLVRRPLRPLPAKPKTAKNLYNKAVKRYNKKIDEALIRYEILGSIEMLIKNVKNS